LKNNTTNKELIVFQSSDNEIEFQVFVDEKDNTVWVNQDEIMLLFNKAKRTIGEHISNIYKEGELDKNSTWRKSRQVQTEGKRKVERTVNLYNLDVIISVGYRVKSKRGVEFRKWATKKLKEHLIKGFTLNETRLEQLKKTIQLVQRTSKLTSNSNETKGLIDVLSDYTSALDFLDDYDYQKLQKRTTNQKVTYKIDYPEAIKAISLLRDKFGGSSLFGNEKDQSFKSSIAVIDQTFNRKELYTSIEEKAGNLLYFVVKNHSFTDGNKRIAAWLFIWYLDKNNFLYNEDGSKKISNNTLIALTLMIAESNPAEKDIMVTIIINLINSDN